MDELRRAFAALSVPMNNGALKMLFKQIDTDCSGSIDFKELNSILRKEGDRKAVRGKRVKEIWTVRGM